MSAVPPHDILETDLFIVFTGLVKASVYISHIAREDSGVSTSLLVRQSNYRLLVLLQDYVSVLIKYHTDASELCRGDQREENLSHSSQ